MVLGFLLKDTSCGIFATNGNFPWGKDIWAAPAWGWSLLPGGEGVGSWVPQASLTHQCSLSGLQAASSDIAGMSGKSEFSCLGNGPKDYICLSGPGGEQRRQGRASEIVEIVRCRADFLRLLLLLCLLRGCRLRGRK